VKELNEKASADIRIVIVGNKIDLDDHQVTRDEATDYARGLGLQYYEVSAKQNMGVDELFKDLAKKLPKESTNKKQNSLGKKKKEQEATDSQQGWCC
jgi:GTPase SAR1 family protein